MPDNAQQLQEQAGLQLDVWLNAPVFGFENCVADWAFLSYLQYFGDTETRTITGYDLNEDYFELIVRRDPRFLNVYPFLSAGVSYYQGNPELAIALMEQAATDISPEQQPDAFLLWRYVALDRLLLLGDGPGAAAAMDRAAEWADRAGLEPHLSQSFRETARFFRSAPDSQMVQFYAWNTVFQEALDRPIKERAARELNAIGAEPRRMADGRTYFVLPSDPGTSGKGDGG